MHSHKDIDPMTKEHKGLVGLEDTEENKKKLNQEDFIREFQEINYILKDLSKEVIYLIMCRMNK
jgi:hypothetical protein